MTLKLATAMNGGTINRKHTVRKKSQILGMVVIVFDSTYLNIMS